jgi:hypothetical protein
VWLAAAGLGLSLGACAVPEAPEWDVNTIVPFSSEPLSIADYLPGSVEIATVNGQSVFTVEPQQGSLDFSLGQMCPDCIHNTTQPVPTFEYVDSLEVGFSDLDLARLEVVLASLTLPVVNNLNFDRLRPDPDPGAAGFLELQVRDLGTGASLQDTVINGSRQSLPGNTTTEITLPLADATITDGFRVVFHVFSPADGQTVQIDTAQTVSLQGVLDELQVAAVIASVAGDTLDQSFTVDIDQDVRDEVRDRVQSAGFELELIHDLELDGDFEISIAGSLADLFSGNTAREVRLGGLLLTPNIVQSGQLTTAEIDLIVGFPDVLIGYRAVAFGTRTGPQGRPNLSRFTPDQSLRAQFTILSRIRIGG